MNHFALLLEKAWLGSKNLNFIPAIILIGIFLAFKLVVPLIFKKDEMVTKKVEADKKNE